MKKMKIFYLLVGVLLFSCKEKYLPQLNLPVTSFLVVEGYINNGPGGTTITLSRTTKLTDTVTISYEPKANVRIEGRINTTPFLLTETSPGKYNIAQLTLNPNDQYRVRIATQNGRVYVSEFSDVRTTPTIDSISWKRNSDGVQIYANTHDAQNKTKYYQYHYEETWEFHSRFFQSLKLTYNNDGSIRAVGYIDSTTFSADTTVYKCWQSNTLTNITTATSEQLAQDVISLKPLQFIENGSWKLSQLYSIMVKQRALSREGYRFLEQLKKNTEQLGSIFDSQPSDNNGNMRCLTNAAEPVLGFIEVTQEKEQRIWISAAQLPGWNWNPDCEPEIKVKNHRDSLEAIGPGKSYLTTPATVSGNTIIYVYAALPRCVDCRLLGYNKKPAFWP